jgi:hypothetical protein
MTDINQKLQALIDKESQKANIHSVLLGMHLKMGASTFKARQAMLRHRIARTSSPVSLKCIPRQ